MPQFKAGDVIRPTQKYTIESIDGDHACCVFFNSDNEGPFKRYFPVTEIEIAQPEKE